ncbi:esterase/lipase family protein [Desulfococcus sp.]|uniref:esterase/lipase family protein n=1 Tax=Desulfococcus sp. TaxID=2025834 RepID=UPI003593ABD9
MVDLIESKFRSICITSLLFFCLAALPAGTVFAGSVSPGDLDRAANDPGSSGLVTVQRQGEPASVEIEEYTEIVLQIHMNDPDTPASVLGCVIVRMDAETEPFPVSVPLIEEASPGTVLPIVQPNQTGSAWARSKWAAVVDEDGFTATFETGSPGVYAVYNPEREAAEPQGAALKSFTTVAPSQEEITLMDDPGEWGLLLQNGPSETKIPLIIVHGDNSFRHKGDRWDDFLDWVSSNPEFDSRYEIWRFRHNTETVIGYNGQTGNAKELGDAILNQFGPDRKIMLMAHSRGGLVCRAYMNRYGDGNEGDRVLGLVALATPHHGSPGAVPEWGLETVNASFKDTELAKALYGTSYEAAAVNISNEGTMGLAWDNFDGPENGAPYIQFDLESNIGNSHTLSVLDTNLSNPTLPASQTDDTIYLPDRASGTLEELNQDARYFGKIIAYGGYDTDLGVTDQLKFSWLDISFQDHIGLEIFTQLMADMQSKNGDNPELKKLFMANDGMVPLQSAFLLKKDPGAEPMYETKEDTDLGLIKSIEIHLKDFTSRLNFRKSYVCEDFDHLHLVEGKGGIAYDKSDYWDHVSRSIDELASLSEEEARNFTPQSEILYDIDGTPSFSEVIEGDNCFIGVMGGRNAVGMTGLLIAAAVCLGILSAARRKE